MDKIFSIERVQLKQVSLYENVHIAVQILQFYIFHQ